MNFTTAAPQRQCRQGGDSLILVDESDRHRARLSKARCHEARGVLLAGVSVAV